MKRLILIAASAVISASSLTACFPIVVGAAGGGALVATDRRPSGVQLDDQTIEIQASSRVHDVYANNVHVNLTSYNRHVLLVGSVPSEAHRQRIEQIVKEVKGVQGVYNELLVADSATLSERGSDSLLTARAKSALIAKSELSANSFKIVTERGTVYLMGIVTQRESDLATETVRNLSGVNRVVRAMQVVTEDQLKNGVLVEASPSAGDSTGGSTSTSSQTAPATPTDNSTGGYQESGGGVTVTPIP